MCRILVLPVKVLRHLSLLDVYKVSGDGLCWIIPALAQGQTLQNSSLRVDIRTLIIQQFLYIAFLECVLFPALRHLCWPKSLMSSALILSISATTNTALWYKQLKVGVLGTGSSMHLSDQEVPVSRPAWKLQRITLLVYIKLIEWGMKLPVCLYVWPSLLSVSCIEHSHIEVLTYSPGLAELASVDYFIGTSWTMFSFNHTA